MEDPERWKEVFQSRECRELFEDKVDAVQCATNLKLLDVLTRSDLEVVQSCVTSEVACVKLLDFLVARENSWRELLNYLQESNQRSVVRDLEKVYQNDKLVRDNRIKYYQSPEGLPIPKQWNVPPRNPYFTGRDQLLEQLASSLNPSQAKATVISACQGMGGVGKTQLAVEFAHRHKNYYSYVFWFMAGESSQIETDYSRLADMLNIDTQRPVDIIVAEMKAWLDRHPGGLLVYDNASNPEALQGYLPTMETSSILVTSRTTQWDDLGKSFTVNVFTADEARAYFKEELGNLFELEPVDILAETLGYLPLALAQAGKYMKRNKVFPSRYLAMYENDKKRLLASKFLPPNYPKPVFVTWDITMQAIEKESQLAPTLLTLCACLSSTDIPYFLLDEWTKQESNNPDQEIFEEALGTLGDYSMLTINPESESVSIHCLVQEVIRLKWTLEDRRQTLKSAIDLARKCCPYQHKTREDFIKAQRLLPHSEVLLAYLDKWPESLEESHSMHYLLKILDVLENEYKITRSSKKRSKLLKRALTIQEQHYGPDHPEVAATLTNLGNAYGHLGQYYKQQRVLERALQIKQQHYGPDHPSLAITLTNLGRAYGFLGQYFIQREVLERALNINERHYGPNDPRVAATLDALGNAYGHLGQYIKEQELTKRALAIERKHYGRDHPDVAITLTNLGGAYGSLAQYLHAQELLEMALEIHEQHYGPDHPQVAITLTNLGAAYGGLGVHDKQREVLDRALAIKEQYYGPDHPQVAITLMHLGNAYGDLGQHEKKRELLERALAIEEQYYGSDHVTVANTLVSFRNAHKTIREDKRCCCILL